jgi:hypothetical protein
MKRKIVALIDQEPEIKRLVDLMEAINTQTQASIDFVKSRLDTLINEARDKKLIHLRLLAEELKGKGVLPKSFNLDAPNHFLGFDVEENTVSYSMEYGMEEPQIRRLDSQDIPPEVRQAIIEHLMQDD